MTDTKPATPAAPVVGLENRLREMAPAIRSFARGGDLQVGGISIESTIIQAADALAKARVALEEVQKRANESGTGTIALVDTIHAMHRIAREAIASLEAMGK